MATSDKLFGLIKSLTKQEKIYFKTYAKIGKSSNKNYILLFDVIVNQTEYDESKIKNRFKNERFIKQLPVAKDYLFKMIMKSLRMYNDFNPPIHIALKQMLHDINILYDKALYHSCEKAILKAKKIAADTEQFFYINAILGWEKKILLSRGEGFENREKIQSILDDQLTALKKEENTMLFRDLFDNFIAVTINRLTIRNKEQVTVINTLMQNPLLQDINNAKSFLSQFYFYKIHHYYNKLFRNRLVSYTYCENATKIFELAKNERFLNEYKDLYCNALIDLSIDLAWLGKETEYDKVYQKFTNLVAVYPELKTIVFPRMYVSQTLLYEYTGKFENVTSLSRKFENDLKKFKGEVPKERLMLVYYNFSCLNLAKKDYKEALRWLNKLLNDKNNEVLEDVYCEASILNLIVHYELGNMDLLESLTRSTYRYLLQRNSLYKFENTVIQFIRTKLPKINNHKDLIEAFKRLKKEFVKLLNDDFEKSFLDTFDYISWLESKIENRPFLQIVQERISKTRQGVIMK